MKARIFIDATGVSIGGGFTYLVNVIPRLCDRAPESRIRLLVRHARLVDALPERPNLELLKRPEVAIGGRLLDTYFKLAGEAGKWNAPPDAASISVMTSDQPGWESAVQVKRYQRQNLLLPALHELALFLKERVDFAIHPPARQ